MRNKAKKNGIPNLKMKIIIIGAFLGIAINRIKGKQHIINIKNILNFFRCEQNT